MPTKSTPPSSKSRPADDWQWFLQALDQKLDAARNQTTAMIDRFHELELGQQRKEQELQQQMHQHRLDLQELKQSLEYLSHKTQLQLKDSEKATERFMHETERKVADIHFATREELSDISRRLEVLEKLLL